MTTIAVDLAKNVFQLAISDERGKLSRKRLSRPQFERFWSEVQPGVHVVMEACGSAHFWARRLRASGHQVTLLPPQYVSPYVHRNKTDAADAEALLRAVEDPRIKPVAIKSEEQQAIAALHRVRSQWVGTRTARINVIRGLLYEFGLIVPQGADTLLERLPQLLEAEPLPKHLVSAVRSLWTEVESLSAAIAALEKELEALSTSTPEIQTLRQVPGIGLLTSTALYAAVGDIRAFPSGRHLSSWLGITPREHSSGSARRLGRISKQGDPYLRTLLIHGARAALLLAQRRRKAGLPLTYLERWVLEKSEAQHPNRAVVALANKMARTAWALWRHGRIFNGNNAVLKMVA